MKIRYKGVPVMLFLAAMFVMGPGVKTGLAQSKQAVPKATSVQRQADLSQADVKQLLLMMDTDKNGKISKKEWMDYMSAEFDRLDKDKSGELDPKELAQSDLRPSTFSATGK